MYDAPSDKYGTIFGPEKNELVRKCGQHEDRPFCHLVFDKSMLFFQRFNGLTPFPFLSFPRPTRPFCMFICECFAFLKGSYEMESEKV